MVDLLDKLEVTEVRVPSDLAAFAKAGVDEGRYRDLDEALELGLRLLQREEQLRAFRKSLEEAEVEAERDGWLTLEEVLGDVDKVIETLPE